MYTDWVRFGKIIKIENGRFRLGLRPYFSQPPYQTLLEEFRALLKSYGTLKKSEDLFPQMDEIYAKVLACFDVAIEQLGVAPTTVATGPSPNSGTVVSVAEMEDTSTLPQPLRCIQPDRLAKRAREEDWSPEPLAKRKKVAQPPPKSGIINCEKSTLPTSTRMRVAREGIRRSERIRDLKERRKLPTVADKKKPKGSRRSYCQDIFPPLYQD